VIDFGSAASLLDTYRLGPLHITAVNVTLNLRRGLSQGFLTKITLPQRKLTRGKSYPVELAYVAPDGRRASVAFRLSIPTGMPKGTRDLVLTGTPSDLAGGGISLFGSEFSDFSDEAGPRSLAALSKQIGGIHRFDGVTASFRPPHKKGEPLVDATDNESLPPGAEGKALRERRVYRDKSMRLSGVASLRVTVR
jgi:hypothetical protein